MPIRALRRPPHIWNDWRGAQVWDVGQETCTVRVLMEAHHVRDFTIATSAIPTPVIGTPLIVRIDGESPNGTVVECRPGGGWMGASNPGSDQAGAVARGEFYPGVVSTSEGWDDSPLWTG